MGKLSDTDLKKILQEKLHNFEAEVPSESEDFIFGALKNLQVVKATKLRVLIYSAIVIFTSIPLGYYFFQRIDQDISLVKMTTDIKSAGPIESFDKHQSEVERSKIQRNVVSTNTKAHISQDQSSLLSFPPKNQSSLIAKESDQDLNSQFPENEMLSPDSSNYENTGIKQRELKKKETEDSLVNSGPTKLNKTKVIMLTLSAQPFLSYKDIKPLADGVSTSNFSIPPALSTDRFGIKVMTTIEFEFSANKFITMGVSYFNFKNSLSYHANENVGSIETSNQFKNQTSGASIFLGTRYPLKLRAHRKQFINLGVDTQRLYGTFLPQGTQFMISLGYANQWPLGDNLFRITPTVSYSITHLHYPGVVVQPYWLGIELSYSIPIRK